MWGGLIFAAKCGEKCLMVRIIFSLKVAAKLAKDNINFIKHELSIYAKEQHTHDRIKIQTLQSSGSIKNNQITESRELCNTRILRTNSITN